MAQRLVALAVALVVVGAPVATMACQFTCEAHDMAGAMAATPSEHHACHGSAPATGPAIDGTAHVCGHPDEFPTSTEQSAQPLTVPVWTAAVLALAPPDSSPSDHPTIHVEQSPPLLAALSSRLRI